MQICCVNSLYLALEVIALQLEQRTTVWTFVPRLRLETTVCVARAYTM